jgi:uncharacterized protein (TIGR02147 family)
MKRLIKLNLVGLDENGRYRQIAPPIAVENKLSTMATRKFNRELMKQAIHSMENDSFETRDLSSTTFTLDPEFIPYAVDRIRNFRRSLTKELENLGNRKEVYALTVQIFPLTQVKKGRSAKNTKESQ